MNRKKAFKFELQGEDMRGKKGTGKGAKAKVQKKAKAKTGRPVTKTAKKTAKVSAAATTPAKKTKAKGKVQAKRKTTPKTGVTSSDITDKLVTAVERLISTTIELKSTIHALESRVNGATTLAIEAIRALDSDDGDFTVETSRKGASAAPEIDLTDEEIAEDVETEETIGDTAPTVPVADDDAGDEAGEASY
jgi:hypothetical protein